MRYRIIFFLCFIAQVTWGQTTVTHNFTSTASLNTSIDTNVSINTIKNAAAAPGYYSTVGGHVRLYSERSTGDGNEIILTPNIGIVITAVSIVRASSSGSPSSVTYAVDGGTRLNFPDSVTGVNAASTFSIKNQHLGDPTNIQLHISSITVTYTTAPTLLVSPNNLSGFTYLIGNGPSTSQSFSVSGVNLDGSNATLSAPTNFEISSDNSSFANTVTLTSYTGAATTIYARLKSGLAQGSYSGNITLSGGDTTTTPQVGLSGSVTAPPPVVTATPDTKNFGNLLSGDYSAAETIAVTGTDLSHDIIVTAPTNFQVYNGASWGTTATLVKDINNAFSGSMQIRFAPTASGAKSDNISLNLNGVTYKNIAVSGSALNLNNASTLVSCLSTTSIGLSWTASASAISGIQYIVFVREGAAVPTITAPVNASTYTANSDYASATAYESLGKVVYKGSSLSAAVTGLTANTQYTFKVVAYKNETGTVWANGINTTGSWNATYTIKVPEASITEATVAPTSSKITWSNPTPISCYEVLVVANQGSVVFTPTGDGSAYTANSVWNGSGNQVVYKGNGYTFTVTGLTENIEYCYKIFVRNTATNQWSSGTQVCQITEPNYCVPIINNTDNIGITQVKFNTINNTSLSSDSYTDYTNTVSTTVLLGESYPLEVNVNVLSQQSHTRVWIDWNRNGTFETAEMYNLEQTYNPNTQAGTFPFNIFIPTNAYIGETRMRVATQHFDPDNDSTLITSPCPTYTSGEVEDYQLIIQRPIGQEITIKSNNQLIISGSTTTSSLNNTYFAQRPISTTSPPKVYTIESIGAQALQLTGSPKVILSGANAADFLVTAQPTSPVAAAGGSTSFEITFTPSAAGLRTAIVSIANGDTTGNENPYTFVIQGMGNGSSIAVTGNNILIPSGNTTTSEADNTFLGFANLNTTNPTTATKEFKISNGGTTNLEINAISLTGTEAANFSVQPTVFLIEPGSFESFIVTFDPATSGAKNATINITSSGSGSAYTFAVQGKTANYITCELPTLSPTEEIISKQDFESTPASPTLYYTSTDIGGAIANSGVTTGNTSTGDKPANSPQYTSSNKGYRIAGGTSSSAYVGKMLTFNTIDTSNYGEVSISVRIAAMSIGSNGNGMDDNTNERILIEVSPDNGTTWHRQAILRSGSLNTTWSFTQATAVATRDYQENSSATVFLNTKNADGSLAPGAFSTLKVTNLPSVTGLKIRISGQCNTANESWILDDVIVKGKPIIATADKVWNGTTWTGGTAPTSSQRAIFESSYNGPEIHACECEINNNAEVIITENNPFIIQSNINIVSGSLQVNNNANLIQINDGAQNFGSITVIRQSKPMNKFGYTYWGVPVSGQAMSGLYSGINNMFQWNQAAQNWGAVSGNMTAPNGYIARAPQTGIWDMQSTPPEWDRHPVLATFTGTANNGEFEAAILADNTAFQPYEAGAQMSFIGNPYPSAINIAKFFDDNTSVVIPTIYLWTHASNPVLFGNTYSYASSDFATFNGLGGVGTGPNTIPTGKVASGQGFFIRGSTTGGTAKFRNTQRFDNGENNPAAFPNDNFYRMHQQSTQDQNSAEKHRFWLNLTGNSAQFKQSLIGYATNATDEIDNLDGEYYRAGNSIDLYSISGTKELAIQSLALPFDDLDAITLGYKVSTAGTYTLALQAFDNLFEQQDIYIKDNNDLSRHNLKDGPYEFLSDVGEFTTRFEVVFRQSDLSVTNPVNNNNWIVYTKENYLLVESLGFEMKEIQVYDILGRKVYAKQNIDHTTHKIEHLKANQVYIIKMISEDNIILVKKVGY